MAEREIKTILTLEDASFSKGMKAATSNVAAIRAEMNAAVAGASGIGKGLKKWSAQTTGLSKALKAQKQQMGVLNKEYKNQNERLKEAAKALKKATQENGAGSEEAKKAANAYAAQSAQVNDLRIKMANLSSQISRDKSRLQENLAKPLKAVGAAAKTMGVAMAAGMLTAGTALIALGKQSLESRQQLNADISASRATFEAWSGLIEQDASNAWKNLGLSKDAYLAEAVTIGEYLQSAGLPVRESASLTEQVLQRAADLAGVYGTDTASAMKAVEQAAQGNYREMSRYGVKLTSNTIKQWALDKGLIATGKDLTKEEEAAYAVQMILEKTASAAGGFATRTDNVNSALETASAAWQDFISGSGSAENVVTAFAGAAKAVGDETLNLIPQMVGGVTSLVQGFVEALPGMLEAAGPTLNLLLTGILSALTDNAEAIGTAAGTLIGTLAASLIANAPTMVSAAIKAAGSFLSGFKTEFASKWNKSIWPAIQKFFKASLGIELPDWEKVKTTISDGWDSIKKAVSDFALALFVDEPNWETIKTAAVNGWNAVTGAVSDFLLLFGVELPTWEEVKTAVVNGWGTVTGAVSDFLLGIGIELPTWEEVKTAAVNGWGTVTGAVSDFLLGIGIELPSWEQTKDAVIAGWNTITGAVSNFMLDLGITIPAWDDIKASVLHLWDQLYASMPGWLQDVLSFFGLGGGSADAGKTALNEAVNSLAAMTNAAAASIGSLSGAAGAAAEHIYEAFTGESGAAHTGSGSKFAGGLWNVPWDNYMARLHSGEMVLTADEARRYRAQTAAGGTVYNDSASIYIDKYNQYSGEDANALLQQMQLLQRRQRMGYGLS